jgi:hypothetical protein
MSPPGPRLGVRTSGSYGFGSERAHKSVDKLVPVRGLRDAHRIRPKPVHVIIAAVEHDRDAPLLQERADRRAILLAETVVQDRRANVGMAGQLHGMGEPGRREHVRTCVFEGLPEIKCNKRLVLDDEDRAPGQGSTFHFGVPHSKLAASLRGAWKMGCLVWSRGPSRICEIA